MECMSSAHRALRVLLQPCSQAPCVELVRAMQAQDHAGLSDLAIANTALFRIIQHVFLDLIDSVQTEWLRVVLRMVDGQMHDHLPEVLIILRIFHLQYSNFLLLLFSEDFAYIRMLLKQKGRVEQFALGALHELPPHAFFHMDHKHVEIHHFPAFRTRNQVQRILLDRALFDLALRESFGACTGMDLEASGYYLCAAEVAGTCVLLHVTVQKVIT